MIFIKIKNFFIYYIRSLFLLFKFKNISLFKKINYFRCENYSKDNIIIMDHFPLIKAFLLRLMLIKGLNNTFKAKIFIFNYYPNLFYRLFYKLLNIDNFISFNYSKNSKNKTITKKSLNVFRKIKSKKDLLNLKIDNIKIGKDIYESYLRNYNVPTLNIKDDRLLYLIKKFYNYNHTWKNIFKKKNVKGIIISHRNYLDFNLLCKICYKKKVPVFTITGDGTRITKFKKDEINFGKIYKPLFNKISKKEKIEAIKISKQRLKLRFSGKVGVDMHYSKKSAFKKRNIKFNFPKNQKKISVLICTNCFYDNPHAYNGFLFCDFYEWIKYLGKISHTTNYNWYIKPHPDYLPGTIEIIEKLSKNFQNIKILKQNINFQSISKHIDYVLTAYGSVGHELPLLGMNVINADKFNPHCSFDFNFNPQNLKEYTKLLLDLEKKPSRLNYKNDIYKFYYLHYFYLKDFNLFFKSKEFCDSFVNSKNYSETIDLFINNIFLNREKIFTRVRDFILNNNKYLLNKKKINILKNFNV